jgi:Na+/melibiose symporter-like transporter
MFALIAVFVLRYYKLTGRQLEKIQEDLKARSEERDRQEAENEPG